MKSRSFIVSGSRPHRSRTGSKSLLYRARESVDQKTPIVNVLIYSQDNAAPVSFIDNKGVLRGIAADLFSVVSLRTGLQFRFETGSTTRN
jgi:two-component system sensor histidine kinase EvgS